MDHYITGNAIRELREKKKSPRKVLRRLWVSVTKPSQNGKQAKAIPISASWSLWLQRWIFLSQSY